MIVRTGPRKPRFPLALIHPLGPLFRYLPLSLRRHLLYLRAHKRWGNFYKPRIWTEKMQWRVINDRRAILAVASDKLASKAMVSKIAAMNQLAIRIPATYWVGTDIRELKELNEKLPARWVLKPNASSGRVCLIDSTTTAVDWQALESIGTSWMHKDEEAAGLGHWGYSRARRLLIAEERIGSDAAPPPDLRTQVFDGKVLRFDWSSGYGTPRHCVACFEPDLNTRVMTGVSIEIPITEHTPVHQMDNNQRTSIRRFIAAIGQDIDYVRVDGYVEQGQYWFGELTMYTEGGLGYFADHLDHSVGRIWDLPDLTATDPSEPEWRALLEGVPKGTLQR